MKIDKFILAIIVAIVLAWFFPQPAGPNSGIPLNLIAGIGISLIFFFYGLKLSPHQIKTGLRNWKLHILVQLTTFLIFPLVVLLFYPFINTENGHTIWLAFLFLGALPSTVSSSVVMVSIARGNIPAAIFNASISGLIGIVITPLWMGLFMQQSTVDFNLGEIYIRLITQILLPVALGLALHRFWGKFARKHSRYLTLFDKSVILLIIYKSFSESFENNVFSSINVYDLLLIMGAVIVLFFGIFFLTGYISKLLHFDLEDRITAQFSGTKKSLVHGTVFAKILFQNSASTGIFLLPIMLFHPVQLLIISFIASRHGKREI
ncbi:bile acid:sodium symporter family protein [Saccharicrinis sp. FJH2]|uniref:bile acid:sodium symporter family protein n=1 Tax=Saccharicrinis sp. FJH65 TaxID=3344659 RepID=UPI0035F2900F